ncbi:hypothetical protein FB45DRAFT_944235 [Roridomyces roridus]|uniref:Uncharacterized protein n=1 Tax=Roridomyces roridus TaxID=1738132 RepID=A0AAD7FAY9_9AGAR|nr:hypothetical protein FB45DRAFT_944235 [Roridomyces roridus]
MSERPYNSDDLIRLKRGDLVKLVQHQQDLWPVHRLGKFQSHKTNVKNMKEALLCPGSRFTTDKPILQVERAAAAAATAVSSHPSVSSLPNSTLLSSLPAAGAYRLKLLIDDVRSMEKIKVSQEIQVPVQVNLPGNLQASSENVWKALQKSISAIKGPAHIGIEDPQSAGYTIYFAKLLGPEEPTELNAVWLTIPQNGCLNLIVSSVDGVPAKRPRSPSTPGSQRETPVASVKKVKSEADALSAGELLWIMQAAESTPGFNEFKQNQHRRLSNAERVKQWHFAASFSSKYYKRNWPANMELSGGKTIKKNAIEAALGMKTTMLSQAINMARIVGVYTQGPHSSAEVAERVSSSDTHPTASSDLVSFLTQWEKDHPLVV